MWLSKGMGLGYLIGYAASTHRVRFTIRVILFSFFPFVNSLGGIKFEASQIIGFCGCRSLQACLRFGWKGRVCPESRRSLEQLSCSVSKSTCRGSVALGVSPSSRYRQTCCTNPLADGTAMLPMLNVGVEASASARAQSCQTQRIPP